MSLNHDGFNFFGHIHGPVSRPQAPELQLAVRKVFGVEGEFHIIGERDGSDLFCVMTMDGYLQSNLLQNDLDIIQQKAGNLTGDLVEVLGSAGIGGLRTFKDCTFVGADQLGELFADGSGQHGWVQKILLKWRCRSPNS